MNLSGGFFTAAAEIPTRSCSCFRESEREFRNRGPKPVAHGVPGRCRYLEDLALSFLYMLALFLLPYPYWVDTFDLIPYPDRIVKQNVTHF